MAHQAHFLRRLDRLELPHVEFALSLYRDHEFLRELLQSLELPEGAERVALSLQHPVEGPFVIVTREGRFVTCLAKGMGVDDLPIVPRAKVDGLLVRRTDLRERLEAAKRIAGPDADPMSLLRRVFTAGPHLGREDMHALLGLAPLCRAELLKLYFKAGSDLVDARKHLLSFERPKPAQHPVLKAYWDTTWALGHLAVLVFDGGPAFFEPLVPTMLEQNVSLSWSPVRQGLGAIAIRGLWGVGRGGKPFAPLYKRLLPQINTHLRMTDVGLGVVMLALRHTRLRSELRDALANPLLFTPSDPLQNYLDKVREMFVAILDLCADKPEVATKAAREIGARPFVEASAHLPAGHEGRFLTADEVPDELALPMAANLWVEFNKSKDNLWVFALVTAAFARAPAEQLYMPRVLVKALRKPWTPKESLDLLEPFRVAKPAQKRPEGPTRSGPCPCGSGKKYKRCCAPEA